MSIICFIFFAALSVAFEEEPGKTTSAVTIVVYDGLMQFCVNAILLVIADFIRVATAQKRGVATTNDARNLGSSAPGTSATAAGRPKTIMGFIRQKTKRLSLTGGGGANNSGGGGGSGGDHAGSPQSGTADNNTNANTFMPSPSRSPGGSMKRDSLTATDEHSDVTNDEEGIVLNPYHRRRSKEQQALQQVNLGRSSRVNVGDPGTGPDLPSLREESSERRGVSFAADEGKKE